VLPGFAGMDKLTRQYRTTTLRRNVKAYVRRRGHQGNQNPRSDPRMQEKAVRFLQDVVGDPDRAEEFEAMSPEEYTGHKRSVEVVRSAY
jgi:hypothetical protein